MRRQSIVTMALVPSVAPGGAPRVSDIEKSGQGKQGGAVRSAQDLLQILDPIKPNFQPSSGMTIIDEPRTRHLFTVRVF